MNRNLDGQSGRPDRELLRAIGRPSFPPWGRVNAAGGSGSPEETDYQDRQARYSNWRDRCLPAPDDLRVSLGPSN